ncbi:response regulator [Maribius pontilimi]|uniref:Response regulator n=1 Tax=Palleronia pontilimi TaxID=1964209 RepID=A0A934MCW2_9RHOB|nr:response regulator [Palleronia pontilimi]MBJ3761701.1 response regulator [Palleronia pontilimi]
MNDYILVVEDEPFIAMDIEMTLSDGGLGPVQISDSAADALKQIALHPPRAAVLGLNLGSGTTSLPVAERLSSLGAPFLFLSGQASVTDALPDALRGAPSLAKPFNDRQLSAAVARLLGAGDPAEV